MEGLRKFLQIAVEISLRSWLSAVALGFGVVLGPLKGLEAIGARWSLPEALVPRSDVERHYVLLAVWLLFGVPPLALSAWLRRRRRNSDQETMRGYYRWLRQECSRVEKQLSVTPNDASLIALRVEMLRQMRHILSRLGPLL